MSVTVTDQIAGMRPRRGVPPGLIVFRSNTVLAGDVSGGTVTFTIETNPAGGELPVSVIITDSFLQHTGNVISDVQMSPNGGHWLEPSGLVTGLMIAGATQSALRLVTPEAPLNFGRATPGVVGGITVLVETNTDAKSHTLQLRGVWAAHDFVLPAGLTP